MPSDVSGRVRSASTERAIEGAKATARLACELALASLVVLFQELTLIRWLPGQVRVLAYFPNLILLAAFLGLGLGCLRAGRRSLLWSWPIALLATVATASLMSGVVFTENSPTEHLWLLYADLPPGSRVVPSVRLPIGILFAEGAACFVALGQIVAVRLREFQDRSQPLQGYCWDIFGSLVGVVTFTAISVSGLFPLLWFAVVLTLGMIFFTRTLRQLAAFVALAAVVVVVVQLAERSHRYSPYYALRIQPIDGAQTFGVLANGSLHQYAFDPRSGSVLSPYFTRAREGYHRPYRMLRTVPKRALVLGAGTGNDVALLLEAGVSQIDAVEIDPVILDFGKQLHPSRPYDSPRVRIINTDGRAFLENTTEKYDLIVFATLDSMTRLSALSNVRLDNFMYTVECLSAARRHLTPEGGIVMYFYVGADYIHQRLSALLTKVFGQIPIAIRDQYYLFNRVYMAGPAFDHVGGAERREAGAALLRSGPPESEIPTDDWPFLYLRNRGLSTFYLSVIAMIALITIGAISVGGSLFRSGGARADWQMFFFGLGFLLLETRAVTQMNLLWGVTWLTSAVVFASILATILAATVLIQFRPIPFAIGALGLALSLVAVWIVPVHSLLAIGVPLRFLLSLLSIGPPIFFAAVCFSDLFRDRAEVESAFGWNLLGAVAGGLLELTSMAVGMRALVLVALVAYLVALWIEIRRQAGRSRLQPVDPAPGRVPW